MAVRLAIEGKTAGVAWDELVAAPGLTGQLDAESLETNRDVATLAAVGAVFSIAANSIKIGEFIHAWWKRRKSIEPTLSGVFELPDGTRFSLDNATDNEIALLVRALVKSNQ
jgi:hypothetical protein